MPGVKRQQAVVEDRRLMLLNELIRECTDTLNRCQKAGECRIDVDKQTQTCKDQLEIAKLWKRKYYGDQP